MPKFKVVKVLADPRPIGRYYSTQNQALGGMESEVTRQTMQDWWMKYGGNGADEWLKVQRFNLAQYPWAVVFDIETENEWGVVSP